MIEDYIEYISLKRKELGGHAICPFAQSFLKQVKIIESLNLWEDAISCISNKKHPMLYIIYSDKTKYSKDWLKWFCSIHEKYAKDNDLWLTWDHPNQINKINGIKTNNNQYSIILIQRLQEIKNFSKKLSKTDYYEYWDAKYFDEIVTKRDNL